MDTATFLLPGQELNPSALPSHPKAPLKLGPGLRHILPSTIISTVAGQLCIDAKKNAVWVEFNSGHYFPTVGDMVIATIQRTIPEYFLATLSDFTVAATLPVLAFEGSTKKYRPQLPPGSLVYARVTMANKHMEPELECYTTSTGKSDGLGELKGGLLFNISLIMCRRLMMPKPAEQGGLVLIDVLADSGMSFELAVGRNGKVWVDSKSVKNTLAIGKAIQETDSRGLGLEEQKKLARRLSRDA